MDLKMKDVKSYQFVRGYFSNPEILVNAIQTYSRISKVQKDEYTLIDLLK